MANLNNKIREKSSGLSKKKNHRDSASADKSVLTMAKFIDLRYELLEHRPHSLDLAPSNFRLLESVCHRIKRVQFIAILRVIL